MRIWKVEDEGGWMCKFTSSCYRGQVSYHQASAGHVQGGQWDQRPQIRSLVLSPKCIQFSSVAQLYLTLCDMTCSTPGLPVHHQLPECTHTHIHWVGDVLKPSYPLLLLPSIFPSIRVFSNESALCIRWPKYWSFSFNISPSNEHPGLICFRMDWLDLPQLKSTNSSVLSPLYSPTLTSIHAYWKNHSLD